MSSETWRNQGDLRIVDLSFNSIRNFVDSFFVSDDLEKLDLSHNLLSRIPAASLTNVAALSLCELDLSYNSIASIHSMDLSNKFRVRNF